MSGYPIVRQEPGQGGDQGIQDGTIDFGLYRVRVRRWLVGDGLWRDGAGNAYGPDGVRIAEDGADPELALLPDWTRAQGRTLCSIQRPYAGGARKPPPYVRRLNQLRRDRDAGQRGGRWHLALRVYAGPDAWRAAKAAMADEAARVPLVVLPPGDDPRAYDWGALALWRYGPDADLLRVAADRGELDWAGSPPVRGEDAYRVHLHDERAPVDEETRDLLAALLIRQGHHSVMVRALPGDDGRPGHEIDYVREPELGDASAGALERAA